MENIKLSEKELRLISAYRTRARYKKIIALLTVIFVCAIIILAFCMQYNKHDESVLQYMFAIFFVVFAVVLMLLSAKMMKESKRLLVEIKKEAEEHK
jgi:uncharacterized membrane protein